MQRDVTSSTLHSKDGLTEDQHHPISKTFTDTHLTETPKTGTGGENKVPFASMAER